LNNVKAGGSTHRWGAGFDPDRLAMLELRMWKAYYRRQAPWLFGLLVLALREQGGASWPRALWSAVWLTRAAVGFARSTGDYERFARTIARGYRALGLPATVDLAEVGHWELRWWVVRREVGLVAGDAAGEAITNLFAAFYNVPRATVAQAGRLRGLRPRRGIGAPPPILRAQRARVRPTGPRSAGSYEIRTAACPPQLARVPVRQPRRPKPSLPSVRRADGPRPTTRTGTARPPAAA
jgi:hypothetical protein